MQRYSIELPINSTCVTGLPLLAGEVNGFCFDVYEGVMEVVLFEPASEQFIEDLYNNPRFITELPIEGSVKKMLRSALMRCHNITIKQQWAEAASAELM